MLAHQGHPWSMKLTPDRRVKTETKQKDRFRGKPLPCSLTKIISSMKWAPDRRVKIKIKQKDKFGGKVHRGRSRFRRAEYVERRCYHFPDHRRIVFKKIAKLQKDDKEGHAQTKPAEKAYNDSDGPAT